MKPDLQFLMLKAGVSIHEGDRTYEYEGEASPGVHLLTEGHFAYEWTDDQILAGVNTGSLRIADVPGYRESPEQATGAVGGELSLFRFDCPLDRRSYQTSDNSLVQRTVMLFGCGALGTKIATSLARSEFGRIVAVDDDLAHGRNPAWGDVGRDGNGTHRAEWLCYRLFRVDPGVHPFDQHRSSHQQLIQDDRALSVNLSNCDLIIDATASGETSDQIMVWAERFGKPLLWADVLADGLGGVVGRWRPETGTAAKDIRDRMASWYSEVGAPVFRAREAVVDESRNFYPTPFTNENAISLLAACAAGLAADLFAPASRPSNKQDVYLVGAQQGWIFDAPFTITPLDVDALPKLAELSAPASCRMTR